MKQKLSIYLLAMLGTVCLLESSMLAYPCSAPCLETLEKGDAIVVARAIRADLSPKKIGPGNRDFRYRRMTCEVLQQIKGKQLPKTFSFYVAWSQCGRMFPESFITGETAILSLKWNRLGVLIFADRDFAKIPLPKFKPVKLSPEASLREKLGQILLANYDMKNKAQLKQLLYWCKVIKYPLEKKTLVELYKSKDKEISFLALMKLVRQADKEYIEKAIQAIGLKKVNTKQSIELAQELGRVAKRLNLTQIHNLAVSDIASVQEVGVYMLRSTRRPCSIPLLIRLLDSKNREVQYHAVMALALTTRKKCEYGPAYAVFMKNPQKTIDLWKKWWQQRQKK